MSFEIYVQCFQNGKPAGIPRDFLRRVFAGYLYEQQENYWLVEYGPHDSCNLALSPLDNARDQIHYVTVERPCKDVRLWQSLVLLLGHKNTVLFFPGSGGPLLLRAAVADHLPLDMLDSLGKPHVISDGPDIVRYIENA
jgi:hypothetical protein